MLLGNASTFTKLLRITPGNFLADPFRSVLRMSFLLALSMAMLSPSFAQKDSIPVYDKILSPADMKKDLSLFRDIREKANSGLYRYRNKKSVDSIYKWASRSITKPLPTTEFFKIILVLTDFEGSCHNYTEVSQDLLNFLLRQKAFFPYALKYIGGNIIFNNSETAIPVGSRILSINEIPDTALMASFYKHFPADGFTVTEKLSASVDRSFGIRYLLEYGLKDSFVIEFNEPGSTSTRSVTLDAVSLEEREKNLVKRHSAPVDSITNYNIPPSYSFSRIDSSTGLLKFRIFNMATGKDDPAFKVYVNFIDSVFLELDKNNIQHLIMDIRGNPGGSDPTFEQPMMYLTDKPFKENTLAYITFDQPPHIEHFWGISTSTKMSREEFMEGEKFLRSYYPQLKNGRNLQNPEFNPVYYPKQPAFKGKLYLLIDQNVASAASHLASLVKAYATNATIVGVETVGGYYGHNGHIAFVYELPQSKIKTKFSIVYVVQDAPPKPDQPEGRGIIPHHEVWPGFDDFIENRDTQMEFVKKLIRGKIVILFLPGQRVPVRQRFS